MKILLITPPDILDRILGSGRTFSEATLPIGYMTMAAVLREHGYEVEIKDAFLEKLTEEEIVAYVSSSAPDLVGFYCLTANASSVFRLGKRLLEEVPATRVVLGHIHAAFYHEFFLKNNACHFVVHGEGEYTLLGLVQALGKNQDIDRVLGISWKTEKGNVILNPPRPLIEDLDELPLPAWDLVPLDRYQGGNGKRVTSYHVLSSRGCIFNCRFCVVNNSGTYRVRSAMNVVDEIEAFLKQYPNVESIGFPDPLFVGNRRRVETICSEILRRGLKFKWACEGHINCFDSEMVRLMADSGCRGISFGIESGNQAVLNRYNKRLTIEKIEQTLKMIKKTVGDRIELQGLFILGGPDETDETIQQTIDFSLKLPIDRVQFSIFTPYPGSYFFDELVKAGKLKFDLDDVTGMLDFWDKFSAYPAFTKNLLPVYSPDSVSPEKLRRYQKKALRSFYLKPDLLLKNLYLLRTGSLSNICRSILEVFLKRN